MQIQILVILRIVENHFGGMSRIRVDHVGSMARVVYNHVVVLSQVVPFSASFKKTRCIMKRVI